MTWLVYAFISGFGISIVTIIQKKVLQQKHSLEYSAAYALANIVVSIPLLFLADFSGITAGPMALLFVMMFLSALAFWFIAKATKHLEVSVVSPMFVLEPGIAAVLALVLLGERLTALQVGGIMLLLAGCYVLETHKHGSLLQPLREFTSSRYMHLVFIALLFYGIGSISDRYLLTRYHIDPVAYLFLAQLFLGIHFVILSGVFNGGIRHVRDGFSGGGTWIAASAIVTVVSRLALLSATSMAMVGLVIAIKRMSSLFTTIVGGELFHEQNLLRKSLACIIMIGGAILIAN